ncbi:MAG TPA: protein-L-isoaspartate(D-aspartate) O-methyltransferase [Casimicrobiaceae bacterium]|nr:protein-L-isoaspartate(D-aspartate) O-methyltransferase [Casimicrobiaceae bacterium]
MPLSQDHFEQLRQHMVAEITAETVFVTARIGKAALSERAMAAIAKVPRHEFVPAELQPYAYANVPLPIGCNKTISQPFIVALMTDMLDLQPQDSVLEVGTGLGYQAAVLAELAGQVYSIDIIEELLEQARTRLARQRYRNIEFKLGNGCYGWPEHAPFDKIIVTAAPDLIPGALLQQLKAGGRMIIPTGLADAQQLVLVEKDRQGATTTRELIPVRFSQLEGTEAQSQRGS